MAKEHKTTHSAPPTAIEAPAADAKAMTPSAPASANGNVHAVALAGGEMLAGRFTKVGQERTMYNVNKGCEGPLVGYLINLIPMPPIERAGETKDWNCFVIKTTEPAMTLDREGECAMVPPGSIVLTPATFDLTRVFSRASHDPHHCYEVFIAPKGKIDIGHGQQLWKYEFGVNMSPASRKPRASFGIDGMLGTSEVAENALASRTSQAESLGQGDHVAPPF